MKNVREKQSERIFRLAMLGLLTALVLIFQISGTSIRLGPTNISLTLIPIVLGAMILGPSGGAWLGFMFGLVVYVMGAVGMDGFTHILFAEHPLLTALTCFGKGIAAGAFSGLVYRALVKRNGVIAALLASVVAPVTNTALFILGGLCMSGTLSTHFVAEGSTVIYFLIIGCAGLNFIFELLLNVIFAPALHTVMKHLKLLPRA